MCIGTSVVEEVQDVVPMVDQSVCQRLEVFISGLLYFVYPFMSTLPAPVLSVPS
mgnify:CR=1 FL=1